METCMNKRERSMTCKNCGHHKSYHQYLAGNQSAEEIECRFDLCGKRGNCKRFHSLNGDLI